MRILKQALPALLLALAMVGCATTSGTITNLTPQYQTRNANGLYPVEASFTSQQQTLRWDSIQPSVVIGTESYPMRPTPLMKNRWETLIPVPPGQSIVNYKYKFDYTYNTFGAPKPDSKLSPQYRLKIVDR